MRTSIVALGCALIIGGLAAAADLPPGAADAVIKDGVAFEAPGQVTAVPENRAIVGLIKAGEVDRQVFWNDGAAGSATIQLFVKRLGLNGASGNFTVSFLKTASDAGYDGNYATPLAAGQQLARAMNGAAFNIADPVCRLSAGGATSQLPKRGWYLVEVRGRSADEATLVPYVLMVSRAEGAPLGEPPAAAKAAALGQVAPAESPDAAAEGVAAPTLDYGSWVASLLSSRFCTPEGKVAWPEGLHVRGPDDADTLLVEIANAGGRPVLRWKMSTFNPRPKEKDVTLRAEEMWSAEKGDDRLPAGEYVYRLFSGKRLVFESPFRIEEAEGKDLRGEARRFLVFRPEFENAFTLELQKGFWQTGVCVVNARGRCFDPDNGPAFTFTLYRGATPVARGDFHTGAPEGVFVVQHPLNKTPDDKNRLKAGQNPFAEDGMYHLEFVTQTWGRLRSADFKVRNGRPALPARQQERYQPAARRVSGSVGIYWFEGRAEK